MPTSSFITPIFAKSVRAALPPVSVIPPVPLKGRSGVPVRTLNTSGSFGRVLTPLGRSVATDGGKTTTGGNTGWAKPMLALSLLLLIGLGLLSQQAYAQTCSCTDYIYLNDEGNNTNTGFVHKFRANANGTLTEVPNGTTGTTPWFPAGGGLPKPHGLGQDLNGNVYIGQDPNGPIAKLSCNGTMLNPNFINDGGYNIDSRNGIIYVNSDVNGTGNRISAYKLCDGSSLGYVLLNGIPATNTNVADWGLEIEDDGTFYATGTFYTNSSTLVNKSYIYRFKPTLADFTAHTTYNAIITDTYSGLSHSVFPNSISNIYDVFGITSDPSGNMYVVVTDYAATPDRTYILKFNAAGSLVASTSEAVTNDNSGFEYARGILYYNGFLYLGGGPGGDCLAKVNASTLAYAGSAIAHAPNQLPKGIRLVRECCPTAATTTVDTTLCSVPTGTQIFLQQLIKGCGSPICGGNWAAVAGNIGATYNACDNSITINQANVCASFRLTGGGGNSECNSFTITVNVSAGSVKGGTASPSQTICANTAPPNPLTVTGTTGSSALSYQWQRSTTNCNTGFSNIAGATSATYNPGILTTTSYFRAITSVQGGCNLGPCKDTTNCVTITVNPAPTANLSGATICAGQTATLTATGGSSYTFSTGLVNTTGVLTVSPTTTTTYSVTVANASGCRATDTGVVTVNPAPTANLPAASICAGQTATLTATGGTSYTFSTGLVNTTGVLTVSPTTTTTYSVTVANASGCRATDTGVVTVNPAPTANLPAASICAGQTATLTATGGTSYTFSTGLVNTTGVLTVSPTTTTTYSVTVANASGCRATDTGVVTVNPAPTANLPAASICAGQTATLTATGGTSYTFSTGLVNTSGVLTVSPTTTTTYSVTVANASGCRATDTGVVTVNPAPTANLPAASICAGQTATLTATGGTSYTFSTGLVNTSGVLTVSPTTTTTYSVTVANASGCRATDTGVVTVNPAPTANLPAASICAGQTATLTATGGTSYTFSTGLVNTSGVLTVSPTTTTTYSVTVANASGCRATDTGVVTVNPAPTANLPAASICAGQTATLTATGGTSYTFSTGLVNTSGVLTVSPTTTTTYSVTVANASGCRATDTGVVTVNPAPTANLPAASICAGQTATLTATGGTSYTFSTGLVNTSGVLTVSPTTTTTYSVTVANASGCRATDTGVVTVNPAPTANLPAASICAGQTATLTATGGTSYTFSTGLVNTSGVLTVSPTTTTTYSVTVANASGCRATDTGVVTVNPAPTANLPAASICAGQTATLTATGGTSYTFSTGLVNTSGVLTVSPTTTTTYSVTVANASGCRATDTGVVTVNPAPTANLPAASICAGQTATLTATGGSSYTFSTGLVNTSGILTVSPTTTTTYSVTVANANGCRATDTGVVTLSPSPVPAVTASSQTICAGQSTTLTASGGTAYLWSTGANTPAIVVKPTTTTTYSVTVTNASGCASTTSITVSVRGLPQITAITQGGCVGSTASLTVTATNGGSGTLEYSLNGGTFQTSPIFTINASGSTTATIVARTQGSTCTDTDFIVVNCACATPASVTLSPSAPQTCGRGPVSLAVNVSGAASASLTSSGSGVFSQNVISGSQTITYTPSVADVSAGSVTLVLTSADPDGAGLCVAVSSRRVLTINPAPSVLITPSSATICGGQFATLTASGASTYVWSNGATTQSISVSVAGPYSVTGTSLQSCTATATATVTVNPAPTANLPAASICAGQTATLTATGGTSYTFSTGLVNTSGVLTVSPTTTTTYSVTVANASGCRATDTGVVTLSPSPVPAVTASSQTICAGQSTTLTASGGTAYLWSTGANTPAIVVKPTTTTTYSVTVTNASGCASTTSITVSVRGLPQITAITQGGCVGSTASLTVTATNGGSGTLEYSLNGGTFQTSPIFTINASGSTTATIVARTQGSTCTDTDFIVVNCACATPASVTLSPSAPQTCGRGPVSLAVNVSGAASASLTSSGSGVFSQNVISGSQTITYTPSVADVSAGSVTLVLTSADPDGAGLCVAVSSRRVLTINPAPSVLITPSSATICGGQFATLTASGASTYVWSNGATTQSISVSVAGPYSVTGTSLQSCTATATATVTVNPAPTANLPAASICAGQTATLTATGGTSYTFSTGLVNTSGVLTVSPTTTTTYSVTVANASGCRATDTGVVTVNPAPTANLPAASICAGQTATLTATGGTSYTFSTGLVNTSGVLTVSPTTTTTYSVTVANASGCRATDTGVVTVNPAPTANLPAASICAGQTATLTATGGTSYTFSTGLVNTSGVLTVSPTTTTTYSVTVANASGCRATDTGVVTVNPAPAANLTSTNICAGQTATLTATGGSSYTFSTGLVNTSGILTVGPTTTTTYSVTVANASGCRATATGVVTVNPAPTANLPAASICAGQTATLTATGGTSYTFSTGLVNTSGVLTVSPTTTTTYSVTVANASGCRATATGVVTVNPAPTANLPAASICAGQTATLTATGGTSYTFSNGTVNTTGVLTVSPTTTTTYSVTVANASGCRATDTGVVTVNPTPTANLTSVSICAGQTATLTATGGTSYTFSTGLVNTTGVLTVSPTTTTTYSVTVANASGCRATNTGVVTVNPLPTANLSSASICAGQTTTLTATGGSSYTFSNGTVNTTGTLTVSPTTTTTYSVTVANASGCRAATTGKVTVNPLPTANLSSASICAGQSVTLTATGGTSYTFSNGTTNTTGRLIVSPTTTTTYSVTVANGSGCRATDTGVVTINPSPIASVTATTLTICAGQSTILTASGGTDYDWSTGASTPTITVNPTTTTTYSVTVSSASGCTSTTSVTVTVRGQAQINGITQSTLCVGNIASLTINATNGGNGILEYSVNGGAFTTSSSFTLSAPTSITASVVVRTQGSTCTDTDVVVVNCACQTPASLTLLPATPQTCGTTPVSLTVNVTGASSASLTSSGSGTFSQAVINGNQTVSYQPSAADTQAGSVTLTLTSADPDGAGSCVATQIRRVLTLSPAPSVIISAPSTTLCAGQSVVLRASGANTYRWSTGATTQSISVSVAGPYSVTGTSLQSCTATASVTVTVNPSPTANLTSVSICAGQTATLTATGGSSYTFSNGTVNTSGILTVSPANTSTYSVTVANVGGCRATDTGVVTVNPAPTADLTSVSICAGQTATLTATGGTSYTFSTGDVNTTGILTVSPASTSTYSVTVANADGCVSIATATVTLNQAGNITLTSASICAGQTATLTATGGNSYAFSTGDVNSTGILTVSPTITTTYSVTVDNGAGCGSTAAGLVTVNPLPTATLTSVSICAGQTATLTATGGTSYTFSTGDVNMTGILTESPTATSTYSVTVANAGGCVSTTTATVTVNPLPTADLTSVSICAGQTATLTATGGTSYTFSTGDVNTTGILTVSPASTSTYSVTVANADGCVSIATATVTLNQAGNITLTSASICAGQTATLTATGGNSYAFSTGDVNSTGILTVSPTITTTYSVTVDNGAGCGSTAAGLVTVNPLPTATLTSVSICAGQTATLTATGGTSYTFSTGDVNMTGILTESPTATSTYSVTVANAGGCVSTTTATVTVNPLPTADLTSVSICAGQTATLTATGGTSYTFSTGDVNTTGILTVSPASTSTYSVTVANASGCVSTTTATVTVNPVPAVGVISVNCTGLTSFDVTFTATAGATISANLGTVVGNTVVGVLSGQTLFITATLNSCTAVVGPITQNCQSTAAGLGDFVFLDVNQNGIQDAGDTPISNVLVTLYTNGVASLTTLTDASGLYSFTGLTPGNSLSYSVGFGTPTGLTPTTANVGANDALDSDADVVTGLTQSVTLANGEFNPTLDAGFFSPAVTAGLGDFVFLDVNQNGIQDAGDTPIPGVVVTLFTNGVASLTTLTDASGLYSFTGLTPGSSLSYSVGFGTPTGLTPTTANVGANDALDSDADVVTGLTQSVTLANGEFNPTLDAGFFSPAVTAGLGDFVFLDVNQNGIQDAGDTPIPGVVVTLFTNGVASLTTLTDASGLYSFTGLTPGSSLSYSVGFGTPTGLTPTTANVGANDALDSDADVVTGLTQSVTLANGEFNPTLDAGFFSPAVTAGLGDFVFLDVNQNGIQDAGDTPISNVLVTLYTNGVASLTTLTDASGLYSFTGLTPGNSLSYSVGFGTPTGLTPTTANVGANDALDSDADVVTGLTQSVTLANGEFNPTLDAGFFSPAVTAGLGDFVFLDVNQNGIQDAGDTPIPGVVVTLFTNGVASLTTLTDASGLYSFTGLTPGSSLSYSVGFGTPTGLTPTTANVGANDALDSDADVVTGLTQSVTLANGEFNPTLDAGFFSPAVTAGLGDFVFLDVNQNGIQDAGDTPIPGVVVTLFTNGVASLTTLTDASGLYSFTGLTPGSSLSYSVGFGTPTGLTPTTANVGANDALDSDADVVTGLTQSVTLANGEFNPTLDAGFFSPAVTAGLGDFVFLDVNQNGIQDAGDTPIPGVVVTLFTNGVASLTTLTDASGLYSFTGLTPGSSLSYSVGFGTPTGLTPTTANVGANDALDSDADVVTGLTQSVTLANGEFNPTLDAGFFSPAVTAGLGDFVFLDVNQNGIQDAGDTPISNVLVTLYTNGVASLTTLTDASGLYSFTGLTPGSSLSYSVGFGTPTGLTPTTANVGANDALDSDADVVTGLTQSVTLANGEFNPTLDAGFFSPAVTAGLGDFVFLDVNQNGIQDAGDTPIPGVVVTLFTNGVASLTTLTDASGLYSFTGLTPGSSLSYSVGFGTPTGLTPTTANVGANDALDSDADVVTGLTQSVTLANGEFNPTLDAGFFSPAVTAGLGDFVFLDVNQNGIQDAGDTPIPGVVVTLFTNGVASLTTLTDASGLYSFTGLTPGSSLSYSVGFGTPTGLTPTTANVGANDALDSDADVVTGLTQSVTLANGEFNPTLDAGFFSPAVTAGLGDFVFLDVNQNGIQDAGDTPIPGVVVTLFTNGVASLTTLTDASGLYSFTGLTPGSSLSYSVGFGTPTGLTPTTANVGANDALDSDADVVTGLTQSVTLANGEFNPTLDAGYFTPAPPTAGLGDFVFTDVNKNGIQDAGDTPLAGVVVTLFTNGVASATTVSSATGFYSFTGLTPGSSLSYSVGFTTPAGLTATSLQTGGNDATDSDASPATGLTRSVTLANGEFNPKLDAGFVSPTPSLTLQKVVDKSMAFQGDTLTYTLILTNTGQTSAINVVVRDSANGLTYVAGTVSAPAGTTYAQGLPVSLWTVSTISAGQSLSLTYQAIVDSTGVIYNTATIPGVELPEDSVKVCTSVPVQVCAGSGYAFELTAPAGYSQYQFYNGSTVVYQGPLNSYTATTPGSYSIAVVGQAGCPGGGACCPVIIQEVAPPSFTLTAADPTCVSSQLQANGQLVLSGLVGTPTTYTYQYSPGATFSAGTATAIAAVPASGVLVSNLSSTQTYTVRVYNGLGCYTDQTVTMTAPVCSCPPTTCAPVIITKTRSRVR